MDEKSDQRNQNQKSSSPLKITVFVVILLLLVAILSKALRANPAASSTPANPAASSAPLSPVSVVWQTYRCDPQPCWHAIRLGLTTRQQAENLLRRDPSVANLADPGPDVLTFQLFTPIATDEASLHTPSVSPPLELGLVSATFRDNGTLSDMILTPSSGTLRLSDTNALFGQPTALNVNGLFQFVYVYYGDHIQADVRPNSWVGSATNVSPDLMVSRIQITTNLEFAGPLSQGCQTHWQGFQMYDSANCL